MKQDKSVCWPNLPHKQPDEKECKDNYLSPCLTKPLSDDPLFVTWAFPPKATIRAVRMALFPPVVRGLKTENSISECVTKVYRGKNI